MKSFIPAATLALLATIPCVLAHITMDSPPPIRHKLNPNAANPDHDYASPVKELCKGYHKLTGADLTPVATWAAGSPQQFTLAGNAVHGGGSCQASLSEDGGATFYAVKTWIGDCPPAAGGGVFDFTVPKETKAGAALFAWTWFNKLGNREMYMNCASVTISGGGSGLGGAGADYPEMLVANIPATTCAVPEGVDVAVPNPGKDVVTAASAKPGAPTGDCGPAAAPGAAPPPSTEGELLSEAPPSVKIQIDTTKEQKPMVLPAPAPAPAPVLLKVLTPKPQGTGSGACAEGEVVCSSETSWALCSAGKAVAMGDVAPGTECVGGKIGKRAGVPIRFSRDHMKRGL